jgi:predicted glycosyltransferase
MKLLFDIGHPAHVHFFKNAIWDLEKRGHTVKITARDKDVTLRLLDAYKLPYIVRPTGWRPLNLFRASRFVRKTGEAFKADLYVGVHNPYVAMAAADAGKKCILFTDTPGSRTVNRFSVDKASLVVTPECMAGRFENQVTYPGYKEMAYLHPKYFTPDSTALARNGLALGEPYTVVRFIGWEAHHDSGVGKTAKDVRAKLLSTLGKAILSLEGESDGISRPEDLHAVLMHASGCVSEGATLAKEAAVLGVPSAYVSPLAAGLPPITALAGAGRLNAYADCGAYNGLPSKSEPMEMGDVTAEIVRVLEASQ